MTSKIKVDNIENQCGGAVVTKCGATTTISGSVVKADDIQAADGGNLINQCGTTITLGASGDTINLASGASQTGFGRTGTVDWDTTPKTASFTGVSGNGYFVNTTSGAITVTLPASPSAGDIISLADYAGTWGTNNVNLSSAIYNGLTGTPALSTNNQTITLIYVDGTKGWITTNNDSDRVSGFTGITATGGTILTSGNFKTHVFTGPGTFCVSALSPSAPNNTVEYLVVAGGASGARYIAGGGGAGGVRTFTALTPANPINAPAGLTVTATSFPITVGAGGAAVGPAGNTPTLKLCGVAGNVSTFSTITAAGGGAGGQCAGSGSNGGSGGGAGGRGSGTGGSGNVPPVSPPQGNNGGNGQPGDGGGGGGGGATTVGALGTTPKEGGTGGTGAFLNDSFFGPTAPSYGQAPAPLAPNGRYFGGGGGAGGWDTPGDSLNNGGVGGGGSGTTAAPGGAGSNAAEAGFTNTGGGGGVAGISSGVGNQPGAGGSGIVMIRYKFQ